MNSTVRFKINTPTVVSESFDDEVVIINLDNGNYYSTNETAAVIWELIDQGVLPEEIIREINQRYAGDPEEIGKTVRSFLTELREENLIVPDESERTGVIDALNPPPDIVPEKDEPEFAAPVLQVYNDMKELLLLDPVHEVDETGWPNPNPENG